MTNIKGVGGIGLEPILSEPKSNVLPLHKPPKFPAFTGRE